MKQRKKRRWSGALALALGLSALGLGGAEQNASSVFAQNGSRGETRDWRNSNGEIALRGALDVERTLDEAPSEGAPNRVYFIDESGVSKYYRYRHLSAEDRELVDEALDAPASPVAVSTEEPASAATKPNQAAGVAAQNAAAEKSDVNAVWAKLRKALLEGDGELANRAFEELAKGAQTPQDNMFLANTRAMTEEYLACFPDGANVWRAGKKAGERRVLKINGVEFPFRWASPGTFAMGGAPNEGADESEKQHEARLTKGFWILETEVTQEMWTVLSGGSNPSAFSGDSNPVENVSWFDCQAALIGMNNLPFITFPHMSPNLQLPAFIFRLPTEAEWEYACRAGTRALTTSTDNRWTRLVGMTATAEVKRTRSAANARTLGVCATCTGTFGSGARIGLAITTRGRKRIQRGRSRARTGFCAAVAGSTSPGAAGRPTGATTTRRTGSATSASVSF